MEVVQHEAESEVIQSWSHLHIITMELERDSYDVVVIGTGLAESIAAASVGILASVIPRN